MTIIGYRGGKHPYLFIVQFSDIDTFTTQRSNIKPPHFFQITCWKDLKGSTCWFPTHQADQVHLWRTPLRSNGTHDQRPRKDCQRIFCRAWDKLAGEVWMSASHVSRTFNLSRVLYIYIQYVYKYIYIFVWLFLYKHLSFSLLGLALSPSPDCCRLMPQGNLLELKESRKSPFLYEGKITESHPKLACNWKSWELTMFYLLCLWKNLRFQ